MSKGLSPNRVNNDAPPFWVARSRSVLSFLESGGAFQKRIFWIIAEIVLVPFSWLISYLQWYDAQLIKDGKQEFQDQTGHPQSNFWHYLAFAAAFAVSGLMGYSLGGFIPGPDWARAIVTAFVGALSLSLLTNVPTILLMYFLTTVAIAERRDVLTSEIKSHHEEVLAELNAHDDATLNGFRDSYWRMDQILGHKVWAEERTYRFLSRIVQNEAREKAKWQMVNFLSRLADNHIFPEEDSGYFKITTEGSGTWHISEYSDFLSDNIVHASKEIKWLVDPKDFFEYLIPYCVSYLLGSIAAKTVGLPPKDAWNETNPFSCNYLFSAVINKACPAYCNENITRDYLSNLACVHHLGRNKTEGSHAREHGIETIAKQAIFLKQDRAVGWWHDLHDIVLPGIAYFGNEVVKKDGVPDEKVILDGFSDLYDNWIRRAFPHIDSFRRASAERAYRQLLLPPGDTVQQALQIVADNLSKTIFNETSALLELTTQDRLTIVRMAFRLFGELSGGAKRIDVCAFKGSTADDAISSFDVGLYDGKFLVRSIANGDFRLVEWYYLFQRPSKDQMLPRDVRCLIDILEYKTTSKLSILLKDTSLWKPEYEACDSEYDLLANVLTGLIGLKWQNS